MDVERMTLRVQNALNEANLIAVKNSNQQMDVIHLFLSLVEQQDGLIPNIFTKMGVQVKALENTINKAISALPKVTSNTETNVYITNKIQQVLIKSDEISI